MPEAIDLTFSNMPLAIGTKVLVEDAGGKDWAVGGVKIVDNVVSQSVSPDAPGGDYTVTWRVVSSDGHPIEGTFGFTAKSGGAGMSSSQAAEPQPSADRSEGLGSWHVPLWPGVRVGRGAAGAGGHHCGVVRRRSGKNGAV